MAKSRVEYPSGDPVKQFTMFYTKKTEESKEALRQAAEDGAAIMRDMIESRETGRDWGTDFPGFRNSTPGRFGSHDGRVASGKMRDGVTSSYTESGKGNAVARFGWLDGVEDYYMYQEGGFRHYVTGAWIEGMYAMQDSRDWVIGELKARFKRGS